MPKLTDIVYRPSYKVDFTIDPLVEEVACLHILKQEEDAAEWKPWIEDMKETMGETLWQELGELYSSYYQLHFLMDSIAYCTLQGARGGEYREFDRTLSDFERMDDGDFLLYMMGLEIVTREEQQALLQNKEKAMARSKELYGDILEPDVLEDLWADPKGVRRRFCEFLDTFWNAYFQKHWQGIASYVHRIARQERAQLEMTDVGALLAQDVENITRVDSNIYIFGDQKEFPVNIKKLKNVHLFLSSYVGERLWYNIVGDELILYLHVPYQWEENLPEVEEETLVALKGVGDRQRIKILRLLWQREATTQQLAQMLDLAESTVSAHLKVLKAGGLVQSVRQKKNVIYVADRKKIEAALDQVRNYLDGR